MEGEELNLCSELRKIGALLRLVRKGGQRGGGERGGQVSQQENKKPTLVRGAKKGNKSKAPQVGFKGGRSRVAFGVWGKG